MASIVTLAVGIACLVAVIVVGTRWRGPRPPAGATRSTAATVLGAVAVAQLIGGFVAMTLLGGFQDLFAVQIVIATLVTSVAVLVLGVGVARHVSRLAPPV